MTDSMTSWEKARWVHDVVPMAQSTARAVLLVLVSRANKTSNSCFLGQTRIADEAWGRGRIDWSNKSASKNHLDRVRRAVRWLEDEGLIEVQPNAVRAESGQYVNRYLVKFPQGPSLAEGPSVSEPSPLEEQASPPHQASQHPSPAEGQTPPEHPAEHPGLTPQLATGTGEVDSTSSRPRLLDFGAARYSSPAPVQRPDFKRTQGQGRIPGGEYRYNRFRGDCCLCGVRIEEGGGTLLHDRAVGKTRPAHHLDECKRDLTVEERENHARGYADSSKVPAEA